VGSEVHDGIDAAQDRGQLGHVRNIPNDQLEALGEFGVPGAQIVVNDGFIAAALERQSGVTADVACASND
jgi:hypothetical protein